ncbi:MAG: hypothetical protein RL329_2489 [Bacteroidota bacterium]|jgi:hypothetical protein
MKKTIREIQADLKEKEKLSANAQLQIKGGEPGCDDKRKGGN